MRDNAIDVRLPASGPEPSANEGPAIERAAEPSAFGLSRGPGAVRTTLLMARVTFREAARRKILWIAMLAGVAFLALFWTALHFVLKHQKHQTSTVDFREGMVMMTMMVPMPEYGRLSLMAVLTSCDTLSGEIASGTIHAIATKPVEALVPCAWQVDGLRGDATLYCCSRGWLDPDQLAPKWIPPSTRPCCAQSDLVASPGAARGYYGSEYMFLITDQRRRLARALWRGLRWRMDRAVWIIAARESLHQSGNSLKSHHA